MLLFQQGHISNAVFSHMSLAAAEDEQLQLPEGFTVEVDELFSSTTGPAKSPTRPSAKALDSAEKPDAPKRKRKNADR